MTRQPRRLLGVLGLREIDLTWNDGIPPHEAGILVELPSGELELIGHVNENGDSCMCCDNGFGDTVRWCRLVEFEEAPEEPKPNPEDVAREVAEAVAKREAMQRRLLGKVKP